MKIKLLIYATSFIITTSSAFGQNSVAPKNISQAVVRLKKETSDSLKEMVKKMDDKDLLSLLYPPHEQYFKCINLWISGDKITKITKYFLKRGISDADHQRLILLTAFKQDLLGIRLNDMSLCRPYQSIENQWAKEDKVRYFTDTLRGVYIPKDINDCFIEINKILPDSVKNKLKEMTEDDFGRLVHFSIGRWIRNDWQLWRGSRLAKYFRDKGVYQPEGISDIILTSYHRFLNKKDIKFNERILQDKDHREKIEKIESDRKLKEFATYKVNDTVSFKYRLGFSSQDQEDKFDNDICIAKGLVLEKKENNFLIKVRVLETCGAKGVIYYDNENVRVYNKRSKTWSAPKKRIRKAIKSGQEYWCYYGDWHLD